ncbi:GntR family transcriptional regulator [Paenibacillus sp. GCM10028914]|uniref:GntR family transcriptional regulator n=1 Tax=Paenibacillus sp. GCM10028914 TaxID=3273416 RepID=UPI0036217C1E
MRIPIQINEHSAEPLYHQIETQLRSLIISGQIEEGTLLPSIREFASGLNCSVITVRRVYQDLEGEGLLRTRQGTGTFVAGVGDQTRERFKRDTVVEALEAAVETGLSVHCSEEELKAIFMEIVQRKYHQQKGGESSGTPVD